MEGMRTTARVLMRHCRNAAQTSAGMLLPRKTSLELAARCRVTSLDIHLPIPSIFLAEMFPEQPPDDSNAIKLMPGTALNGAPNIVEQFILCALVKKIQPQTILEIGTFKGGTTWHLYQNAPQDATIYTIDLPDGEIPSDVTDLQLAANKRRPFLPKSDRVRQILIDSKKWDGRLDSKVHFAFIDADHSYEGIRNDTEKTLPLLDSYACICRHTRRQASIDARREAQEQRATGAMATTPNASSSLKSGREVSQTECRLLSQWRGFDRLKHLRFVLLIRTDGDRHLGGRKLAQARHA